MRNLRSVLVTGAGVVAAAIGGGAIADADTSTKTASSAASPPTNANQGPNPAGGANQGPPAFNTSHGRHTVNGKTETPLTGSTAAGVRAAALKKVSGTVERVETNVDDSAPYEAHIVKPDGTQVIVEVNRDYSVASVETMGGHP